MLNYREACEQAKILSQDGCVRHVNAVLQLPSEFSGQELLQRQGGLT
jgi:hypothetical protein